jgi:hypothetical protein
MALISRTVKVTVTRILAHLATILCSVWRRTERVVSCATWENHAVWTTSIKW